MQITKIKIEQSRRFPGNGFINKTPLIFNIVIPLCFVLILKYAISNIVISYYKAVPTLRCIFLIQV